MSTVIVVIVKPIRKGILPFLVGPVESGNRPIPATAFGWSVLLYRWSEVGRVVTYKGTMYQNEAKASYFFFSRSEIRLTRLDYGWLIFV